MRRREEEGKNGEEEGEEGGVGRRGEEGGRWEEGGEWNCSLKRENKTEVQFLAFGS